MFSLLKKLSIIKIKTELSNKTYLSDKIDTKDTLNRYKHVTC
jgi:hypothetical protein